MNIGRFLGVRLEKDWDCDMSCADCRDRLYVDIAGTTDSNLQAQIDARLDEICEGIGMDELRDLQLSLVISKSDGARILIWADDAKDAVEIPVNITREEITGIVGVCVAGYAQLLNEAWKSV